MAACWYDIHIKRTNNESRVWRLDETLNHGRRGGGKTPHGPDKNGDAITVLTSSGKLRTPGTVVEKNKLGLKRRFQKHQGLSGKMNRGSTAGDARGSSVGIGLWGGAFASIAKSEFKRGIKQGGGREEKDQTAVKIVSAKNWE